MQYVNKKMRAAMAVEAWKRQYWSKETGWAKVKVGLVEQSAQDIYTELKGVDDPEQVNKIIGNTGWTDMFCEQCEISVDELMVFENEFRSFCVCAICLDNASAMLRIKQRTRLEKDFRKSMQVPNRLVKGAEDEH